MRFKSLELMIIGTLLAAGSALGQAMPPVKMDVDKFEDVVANHPAGAALKRLFPAADSPVPAEFTPTLLTKKDYLPLIAGNVDFWKQHLNRDGAIIDFYEKDAKHPLGQERQYSTPAFALAASELVGSAGREDLLEPAVRAFSFALTALVNHTTADFHADFYIPMLIHAHRILRTRVPAEVSAKWEEQFKSIVPEAVYRDLGGNGNWNLVHVSGEAMRRKDKLVATAQMAPQEAYLDKMLKRQTTLHFSKFGMYVDQNEPLAYDAFPRCWMEDMLSDEAYDGSELAAVKNTLSLGSFSSLLLMSPSGEWVCGGRSAQHQWNEAENAVIGECNAARWMARGRPDIAGAFKRMARMCLTSMKRWQRPSGEMWIVKNFSEPTKRFGYEGYSFNSQYNLLPMAMLCIAFERADDSIAERPLPSEFGSYVFDVRFPHHKIAAAAGGYYALIETVCDPHYDATGLLRVHKRGVELSPLTDSSAEERVVIAPQDAPKAALTPGVQWKEADGKWVGLADYHRYEHPARPKPPATAVASGKAAAPTSAPAAPGPQDIVANVELRDVMQGDGTVSFTLLSQVQTVMPKLVWPKDPRVEDLRDVRNDSTRVVFANYTISAAGVECRQQVAIAPSPQRFAFPAMVWDGATDIVPVIDGNKMTVRRPGGELTLTIASPAGLKPLALTGPTLATHVGYVQAAVTDLPAAGAVVDWTITLSPVASTSRGASGKR